MIGLLDGLVFFVGLEMRQSQQIAIAGQVQARNEAFLNLYLTLMGEDPIGRSLVASGHLGANRDPSSLTSAEYDVWHAIKSWQVSSLQNAYQQYEMGLLPDNVWEGVDLRIKAQYANCHIRPIWLSYSTPSVRDYLGRISQECNVGFAETAN